ncbi:MAG: histidine kinase, partial [Bacteroidota bacterium]
MSERIKSVTESPDNILYIGTQAQGLWSLENGSLHKLDSLFNLPARTYRDLEFWAPYLWAVTEKGILKIDTRSGQYQSIRHPAGNPIAESHDLEISGGKLWLSTADGIISFDPDQPHFLQSPPALHLLSFEARDKDGAIHKTRDLPPDVQEVLIRFTGISFSEPLSYAYRMEEENPWQPIDEPFLRFTALASGNYHVEIRAERSNGIVSQVPLRVSFYITPPVWQQIWFIVLIITGTCCIIFLLGRMYLRRRVKNTQEKAQIEQKIADLHLYALRSHLNPHFIFNCLTSIQHLQLSGENEAVLDYLADFGKLIRMTFENSTHDQVSLAQEISFLETYISLEQKRFPDPIKVVITVGEDLQKEDYLIPSMILQPLVENAFQHGLL